MDSSSKMDIETNQREYSWLNNSSFPEELVVRTGDVENIVSSEESVQEGEAQNNELSHESNITSRIEVSCNNDFNQTESYSIVKTGCREYLSVNRIFRPQCPKYSVKYRVTVPKKIKYKRYFKTITKLNGENNIEVVNGEQENLNKRTLFNKNLNENPHNIQNWIDYVRFEDTVYEFEKTNKKGSIAKAQRVLADRKISIIEKGLIHNPSADALYRELVKVFKTYPSDELQEKLEMKIKNKKDNIILWQGLIENSQYSMTEVEQVILKYTKCLSILHQVRIKATSDKDVFEQNILRILYQCGLFLRQTGLFERFWFLFNYYLDLTFSSNEIAIPDTFNEDILQSLEESTLTSNMPKHELWFRIEKLREACHWLPFVQDDCLDPQRMVFNEDVESLIHPIAMPENIFKLVAYVFTLLKVPLVPCRHATMQELGLDYVSWSLDSIESLLSVYLELYPIESASHNILEDMLGFTAGPQYLKAIPGQIDYLKFVLSVMESCADRLQGNYRVAAWIWWCRFQRLLVVLKRNNLCKGDLSEKKIRSSIKNLLRNNKDCELYYVEYALVEKELGNMTQCQNTLKTILDRNNNKGILTEGWPQSQTNQCYLYRVLIQSVIEQERFPLSDKTKTTVLKHLLTLVLQRPVDTVQTGLLMEANTKFKLISDALLRGNIKTLSPAEHFLPDFITDWVICHAWFMYIHNGVLECGSFLNRVISQLKDKTNDLAYQIEVVYEIYCTILFIHDSVGGTRGSLLSNILLEGLQEYPNNLHLLSLLANEQIPKRCTAPKWWNIEKILLKSERPMAIMFCVLILDRVQNLIISQSSDTITGGPIATSNYNNRLINLFKKITTEPNVNTKRCGLIWRLYLNRTASKRNVFYKAIEECPWIKALHMDAVIHMPAELGLIQDLITEKQLRIHVTPEELENLID